MVYTIKCLGNVRRAPNSFTKKLLKTLHIFLSSKMFFCLIKHFFCIKAIKVQFFGFPQQFLTEVPLIFLIFPVCLTFILFLYLVLFITALWISLVMKGDSFARGYVSQAHHTYILPSYLYSFNVHTSRYTVRKQCNIAFFIDSNISKGVFNPFYATDLF